MYHFVLVHGACHGAWCWFKLTDRLLNAGHKVTAIDLAACAIRPQDPNSISTFSEYHQPLMDFLDALPKAQHEAPDAEMIVVVAHSMGGITLQQAMESFSHKINLAIFLAAVALPPGQALVELPLFDMIFKDTPVSHTLKFSFANGHNKQFTSFHFQGSKLGNSCYTGCASEDIVLASTLLRPFPTRMLAGGINYTSEKHGQVPAVYLKCGKDFVLLPKTQDFIAENYGPFREVLEMETAGHSPFFEQVEDLSRIMLQLAHKHAKKSSL